MKNNGDALFLINIVEACRDILAYADVEKEVFMTDKMRQDAIIRKFEILGEAVKNLTEDFRLSHPTIDWKGMAGFRDVLIH